MRIVNDMGLPEAFVDAVENDPYSGRNDGNYISVTSLVAPPQVTFLRRRHWHEIEEPASLRVWSLIGQTAHSILQRSSENRTDTVQEIRLFCNFLGWQINGCFDLYCTSDFTLYDYKVTSIHTVQEGVKPDWVWQLSLLRWLMVKNGFPVGFTKILVIMRDWSPTQAKFKSKLGYPAKPAAIFDVEPYSESQVEEFIAGRLLELQSGYPRECTQEERWQKDEQWAVMKKQNKRATRLFDTFPEAEAFIAEQDSPRDYRIEARESIPIRCESYCNVSGFCRQYQGAFGAGREKSLEQLS